MLCPLFFFSMYEQNRPARVEQIAEQTTCNKVIEQPTGGRLDIPPNRATARKDGKEKIFMKKQNYITKINQWQYAINLLAEYGIKPIDNHPTFSGQQMNIIIHSKQLFNCLIFKLKDTKDEIKAYILREIEIARKYGKLTA